MKNPLIIENPDCQGKIRNWGQRVMTWTLWLSWLYLLLPVFELALASLEISGLGLVATGPNLEIFVWASLLFSVMMLSFWLWIRYNILLYHFRAEGQIEYKPLACNELAKAFGISPLALTDWQSSKHLFIRLTKQGGIYAVEAEGLKLSRLSEERYVA